MNHVSQVLYVDYFHHVMKASPRCFLSHMVKTLDRKKQKLLLYYYIIIILDYSFLLYVRLTLTQGVLGKKNVVYIVNKKLELNCERGKKSFPAEEAQR